MSLAVTHIPQPRATLESCDREPIHIPGAVQSHGVLLAFGLDGSLRFRSANAARALGLLPELGERLAPGHLDADSEIRVLIEEALESSRLEPIQPMSNEVSVGEQIYDLILHQSGDLLVAEFESRGEDADTLASFALKAHRAMDRLKRQRSIESLLASATEDIRQLTGFDRVMAYRFRTDESGEVISEARNPALDAFLGRRYPASDIPAQARRLYVVNTLRMIADVGSQPVAIEGLADAEPLDLSHAVLRAVSPIHIEYLGNMGVGASMSVSIVVQGRLWGMLACHHMTPRQVPYSVRMACDVIAQILAANVHTLMARAQAQRVAAAATLRARLVEDLLHADDSLAALAPHAATLAANFGAHAAFITENHNIAVEGEVPVETARALARWLARHPHNDDSVIGISALAGFPGYLHPLLDIWCGMLALRFDTNADGWLVLLRKEQVETINWGGKPEKHYVHGPNGPRLTPRGSFDLWRETVHGTSEAWDEADFTIGRQISDELGRATATRVGEINRARNQLLAVLGHDLRDPLHSISMAARVLEKAPEQASGRIGQRIQSSSSRMQRLVSQVLDMSRLQGGLGLGLQLEPTLLAPLIVDLSEEACVAHPGLTVHHELDAGVMAHVDADRLSQVVTNLLSNARQHGVPGEPVVLRLREAGDSVELQVRNAGEPIPDDLADTLFNPFKRQSLGNPRNRTGLGLGLYIADQIVRGHGGSIYYSFEEPQVVFSVLLPRGKPQPADSIA
ncbi:GAF domain-containing protein [Xylophilus rhododendri]|uniref:histidine kinase n=1 Tax=Xylophilus rhododendri TaxID=2697032 RepID=A0A857J2A8_9BURK|nr:ATP-binding protein [Xylophilus rhododendri]QHI98060.1 GAF domain-containing protein [Xylophilus rhododendri]